MKVRLEEITKIVGGGTPKRNIDEYWNNGDIVWLSPTDLGEIGEIVSVSNSKDKITQLGLDKSSAKLLPVGTVLYSTRATIGKIAINTVEVSTNQGFTNFICNENVYNKYLAFCLKRFTPDIVSLSHSTTFKEVNRSRIKEFKIPLPPLKTQQTIANTLDQAKALIELRQHSIEKLDELAKSVFIDMFGDPVENSMGWEIVKLSHYGTLARGKSSHRPRNAPELYDGVYPFIQTGDVSNGNNIYLSTYKQTYSELGIKQSRLFKKGIIAIAIAANIGNAKILNFDGYFPDSVVGFETLCSEFSLFLLSFYKDTLDNRATKTAQKNINLKILNDLDVIKVPLPLQQKFAQTIQKIEAQKALYEQQLTKLQEQFDALLARSFEG